MKKRWVAVILLGLVAIGLIGCKDQRYNPIMAARKYAKIDMKHQNGI